MGAATGLATGRRPGTAALLLGVAAVGAAPVPCADLGFAPTLLCSACTKLGERIGASDPLVAECERCCAEDAGASNRKYARAVLEVCK